jgi:hypothetical protein
MLPLCIQSEIAVVYVCSMPPVHLTVFHFVFDFILVLRLKFEEMDQEHQWAKKATANKQKGAGREGNPYTTSDRKQVLG